MPDIVQDAKNILITINEIQTYEDRISQIESGLLKTAQPKEEALKLHKDKVNELLKKLEGLSTNIYNQLGETPTKDEIDKIPTTKPEVPTPRVPKPKIKVEKPIPKPIEKPEVILSPELASKTFKGLSKTQREKYIKELNISYTHLEEFIKEQKKKKKEKIELKEKDYTIYKPSSIGEIANKYAKKYTDKLIKKYPHLFDFLLKSFARVDIPILSKTYISMMLFFSVVALPLGIIFFLLLFVRINPALAIFLGLISPIITLLGFYFYPSSRGSEKSRKIKQDLPFALVHMSTVAGSGANPLSIFELLAESEEYPELKKEIKKILNYVNLFGYNLTNALRNVAKTTPSKEFKELLNGMISTIETGGDLKAYLKEKSIEALNTFKLERKKQVEALATYSEVYTAILIAAPLLLLISLAIINSIGGQIGGVSVSLIAWVTVLVALPLLNVAFMGFLAFSQR